MADSDETSVRRVVLSELAEVDHELVREWLRDPASREWVGGETMLDHALDPANGCFPLMVRTLADGTPIGFVVGEPADALEVSIVIAPSARRQGYATSALRALADVAPFDAVRLTAEIHQDNPESMNSFYASGFVQEGRDDDGYLFFHRDPLVTSST